MQRYIEPVSAQWLTTRQAAQVLGVTPSRVRQFIMEGRLEAQKFGRDLLISPVNLEVFAVQARERTGRPRIKSLP